MTKSSAQLDRDISAELAVPSRPSFRRCRGSTMYHGSRSPLSVGKIYTARRTAGTFAPEVEAAFEAQRPRTCSSRMQSFYMVDDVKLIGRSGGRTDYIYEVVPMSGCSIHHQGWLELAYSSLVLVIRNREEPASTPREIARRWDEVRGWIGSYWDGSPYEPRHPREPVTAWELLSSSVRVVRNARR